MYAPSAALAGDLASSARRGTAMGGFNLFGSLGFAISPFIGGLIADRYGFQAKLPQRHDETAIIVALVLMPFLVRMERGRK